MLSSALRNSSRSALRISSTPSLLTTTSTRSISSLFLRSTCQKTHNSLQNSRALSTTLPRSFASQESNDEPRAAFTTFRPKGNTPSRSIFVGGLSLQAEEDDIYALFSTYGDITGIRIAKTKDGQQRDFAHLDFKTTEAASAAVEAATDGALEMLGRTVRVDFADSGNKPQHPPNRTLYVHHFTGTQEDLHDAFSEFMEDVKFTSMLRDPRTGDLSGQCFVRFHNTDTAVKARKALDGTTAPVGCKLFINYAKGDQKKSTEKKRMYRQMDDNST